MLWLLKTLPHCLNAYINKSAQGRENQPRTLILTGSLHKEMVKTFLKYSATETKKKLKFFKKKNKAAAGAAGFTYSCLFCGETAEEDWIQ